MKRTGSLRSTAAIISLPVMRKPPSPTIATTRRPGQRNCVATAAGVPYPMAPDSGAIRRCGGTNGKCRYTGAAKVPASTHSAMSRGARSANARTTFAKSTPSCVSRTGQAAMPS